MKGKKIDPEFVSMFVTNSVNMGNDSPQLIVKHAKTIIHNIDEMIQKMEKYKVLRSKLLDVVETFQSSPKKNSKDIALLNKINASLKREL
jgi:hypothetical protein